MGGEFGAELQTVRAGGVRGDRVREVVDGDLDEGVRHKAPIHGRGSVVYSLKRASIWSEICFIREASPPRTSAVAQFPAGAVA